MEKQAVLNNSMSLALLIMNGKPWARSQCSAGPPSSAQAGSRLTVGLRGDLVLEEPGAGPRCLRAEGTGWDPKGEWGPGRE